ncbi:hypothetical protein OU415_13090 [Saccharopolyspora sp. WRP15-2]|uniref:Uncharacterized protein n=1 Tax=Saccharopolyspora oryzae TaxID=2997343 RepID=A0ABT4UXF9_9PSEU|nr:hypothetical protein [Saccharopolyspora oryzae]MDA3626375.1 hypothetical protein [Saccharopolyspora oryzae]
MINSLAGFALAASIGIGALLASPIVMSWVEHRMLGPRTPARGRHRRPATRPHLPAFRWRDVIPAPRRASVGGPGAMRKPGQRGGFDRPTAVRSRVKQRS